MQNSGSLPTVQLPLAYSAKFSFLRSHRLVAFHRVTRRFGGSDRNTGLRVLAVTANGEMGLFDHSGEKKSTIRIFQEVLAITYNNRLVTLEVPSGSDGDANESFICLDFDTSSANVRGNETTDIAIKKFLYVCAHFVAKGIRVIREGGSGATGGGSSSSNTMNLMDDSQNTPQSSARSGAGDYTQQQQQQQQQNALRGGGGGDKKAGTSFSIRKQGGAAIKKLWSGFSGVFSSGPDPSKIELVDTPRDGDTPRGGVGGMKEPLRADSTVTVDVHERQRKKVRRWQEEILGRLGEREGVDAKERILDDLSRLEGQLKKQQALLEAPPPISGEDELNQQRALSSLVMFVCRRQALLADARQNRIPQVKPKIVTGTDPLDRVNPTVPVYPSYTEVWRSTFITH